jgi:hypothetical protein
MKCGFLVRRYCALSLWIFFFGLSSCFKDYAENYGEEEIILENSAVGAGEADDALEIAYQIEILQQTLYNGQDVPSISCGIITDNPTDKILTVNFDGQCIGTGGRIRSGKIIVQYANLADSLSSKTITFENFTVNGKKVQGTVSLHDISFLESGGDTLQNATRTLTDFKVEFPNGTSITLNGSNNRQWISGRADSIITNNVYRFEGTMNGVSGNGRTFQQEVVAPVIANFYCSFQGFYPRARGVLELTQLDGYPDRKRTVDYGDGTCDNSITIATFRRTYGVPAN